MRAQRHKQDLVLQTWKIDALIGFESDTGNVCAILSTRAPGQN